jgi:hypothetical protein
MSSRTDFQKSSREKCASRKNTPSTKPTEKPIEKPTEKPIEKPRAKPGAKRNARTDTGTDTETDTDESTDMEIGMENIAKHTARKIARERARDAKIFQKNLGNNARRDHVELTKKFKIKFPEDKYFRHMEIANVSFHDFEHEKLMAEKELDKINEEITFIKKTQICTCDECLSCSHYCCFTQCPRCEMIENLKYKACLVCETISPDYTECINQAPNTLELIMNTSTYVPELASRKGSVRDGTTWRRKTYKKPNSRIDSKKKEKTHRGSLVSF